MAHADASYYGRQKAYIGMGGIGVDEWDIPTAREQLSEYIKQADEEFGDETARREYKTILKVAKLVVSSEDNIQELHQYLVEKLQNLDPDCCQLPRGLAPRLVPEKPEL